MEKFEDIQNEIKDETNELSQTTQERLAGMRKKADLSDIILEKEHSSNDKKKKFLLGAASLVLIFLIVLIISKMLSESSDETSKKASENNSSISSQIKEVSQTKSEEHSKVTNKIEDTVKSIKESTPNIKKVVTTSDTDLKFEEMVRKLKEQDAKESASETPTTNVVAPVVKTTPKKDTNIKITSKPTNTPKILKVDKPKPKKVEIKLPSFKEFSVNSKSGYYIQVGATTQPQPNRALVRKIKSNGFSYTTHSIRVKGRNFNKILIGPFSSKSAALAKMGRVKSLINAQAFLYHLR